MFPLLFPGLPTQALTKQRRRIAGLFYTPFWRIRVGSEGYFARLVYYIHARPVPPGLARDLRNWEWGSYRRMRLPGASKLQKQPVLNCFGGSGSYADSHGHMQAAGKHSSALEED